MPQPYQVLFPIGAFYGLWGALIWVFHLFGWVPYPGPQHAHLMVGGFLFSFALGFLMTAVPRFTGAAPARGWELALATGLSLGSFAGVFQTELSIAVLLFLAAFFASRFAKREYSPPKHFVFIPVGLVLGLAGGLLMMNGSYAGRALFFQGTMLCFVLGVGGKLVSALLGWSTPPTVRIASVGQQTRRQPAVPIGIAVPVVLLVGGFAFELTPWPMAGRILRAAAGTWVALEAWKLHRRPRNRGRLVNWLWISCWGLLAGLWLYALAPSMGVHALHLMFMSGFGLMTLMIASRVTLAHGGYDLALEVRSRPLRWAGALILLAAATRVSAPFTPSYLNHLGYAAAAWVAGLLVWMSVFLPRILIHASKH